MEDTFQSVVARLCCDTTFRRSFHEHATNALEEFDLDTRERGALLSIPRGDLDRFATGLLQKRWSELASIVPFSCRVSPGLSRSYRSWLGRNPSMAVDSALGPGQQEGLRALMHIRKTLSQPSESHYAADLFTFEVYLSSSRQDKELRYLRSGYALHTLIEEMQTEMPSFCPTPSPFLYRFTHHGPQWKLQR